VNGFRNECLIRNSETDNNFFITAPIIKEAGRVAPIVREAIILWKGRVALCQRMVNFV
jgi:hypothetical protein